MSAYLRARRSVISRLKGLRASRAGLPPGLALADVERALKWADQRPVAIRHYELSRSASKGSTYRVKAALPDGAPTSFIYHVSPSTIDSVSPLRVAIAKGMQSFDEPEALVMSSAAETLLAPYVPEVLWSEFTSSGARFLMEDVAGRVPTGARLVEAAGELPSLHRALADWARVLQPGLASRHHEYFLQIATLMREILGANSRRAASNLLNNWDRVIDLHGFMAGSAPDQPIHGDLHPGNLLIGDGPAPRLSVIDWDYISWGPPVIDLATLLLEETDRTQRAALKSYAAASGATVAAIQPAYLHARFHVTLLWACFFASDRQDGRRRRNVFLGQADRLLSELG